MAIELRQHLKLSQQLVITPQLQQAIKLLQLSRMELVDLIQGELMENPVLEEGPQPEDEEVPQEVAKEIETDVPLESSPEAPVAEVGSKDGDFKEPKEFDWENYIGTYNDAGEGGGKMMALEELPSYENFVSRPATLVDHLEWQLRMSELDEKEEEIGVVIIGAVDDNGYLTVSLHELAEKNGYKLEEVEDVLSVIQAFDPTGVGARDLKECLLLQATRFGADSPLLCTIIKDYLPLMEKKDYGALSRKLKLPLPKVQLLAQIICEMEPKPGRPYGKQDTQYITPDVYVTKMENDYAVLLNEEGLPRLRVSLFYRNLFSKEGNGSSTPDQAKGYVQEKLKSALWLIRSIHQRQRTLYKVAKCIVKFQKEFLDHGINHLKPMILKDVAEEIGMHESTVSRATNNKYMHTPQGIFELKFFFNSSVSVTSGQDVASESVKQKIRNMVSSENLRRPMSDKDIVSTLKESNIDIARRTVAKYREILGILPSSKRKQLY